MLATYPLVYFPCFFMCNGIIGRGQSLAEVRATISKDFWPGYRVGGVVWTPVMFIQFFWIPLRLQVLWINSISYVWTSLMSLWFLS